MKLICMTSSLLLASFAMQGQAEVYRLWNSTNDVPMYLSTGGARMCSTKDDKVRITGVDEPLFVFVRATGCGPRPCVLVCPGGSYEFLAWSHEGTEIALWLNSLGYSAAILQYRCPCRRDAALCDAQRAMRCLRANAVNFGIDANKVGVMGFSAGANLAARLSTCWREGKYESRDAVDKCSMRPDFTMLIYPYDLLPKYEKGGDIPVAVRPDYPVDHETPASFVVQSQDDEVMCENALAWTVACRRQDVPVEVHFYEKGGHGYGLRQNGLPVNEWNRLAAVWLAGICGRVEK